jgi:hypothetical protein
MGPNPLTLAENFPGFMGFYLGSLAITGGTHPNSAISLFMGWQKNIKKKPVFVCQGTPIAWLGKYFQELPH